MEVNNIAIKLEKIHFGKDTMEELDKVNVYVISPHKKVFSKYRYNLLDDYYENENLFIIAEEIEPFTIGSIKKYVRQYFGMIYKMNCKRNDN